MADKSEYDPSVPYLNMSDDWYDKAIEQYKGTSYYDTLASNPYLVRNAAPFSPSFGDKFAQMFGDYSAGNRYYADLHNRAAGYLNEQIEKMRQESINLAPGQVAQMRAAGLNPDLQGVQPGSAAENDQPFEPASFPDAIHPQEIVTTVAQTGISLVSEVMSMAQGIQGLAAGAGQIVAQDIANHSGAMDLLMSEIINTIPTADLKDPAHIESTTILNVLDDIIGDTSYSSHTRKILKRYSKSLQGDSGTAKIAQLKADLIDKYHRSKKSIAGVRGDGFFDEDFGTWIENLSKFFNDYVISADKARYDRSIAEDSYNTDYYESRDAKTAAAAGNAADKAATTQSENVQMLEKLWNDVYHFLSNDDHWYSKLALALLPAVRAFTMGQLSIPMKMDFGTHVNNNDNRNLSTSYIDRATTINN